METTATCSRPTCAASTCSKTTRRGVPVKATTILRDCRVARCVGKVKCRALSHDRKARIFLVDPTILRASGVHLMAAGLARVENSRGTSLPRTGDPADYVLGKPATASIPVRGISSGSLVSVQRSAVDAARRHDRQTRRNSAGSCNRRAAGGTAPYSWSIYEIGYRGTHSDRKATTDKEGDLT
jgi:hypothetical protein